jgi:hypothetical protein
MEGDIVVSKKYHNNLRKCSGKRKSDTMHQSCNSGAGDEAEEQNTKTPTPPPKTSHKIIEIIDLTMEERIQRLKEHLSFSKIKHEEQILKLSSLKQAHTYCIIHNVSAQQYGPLLEQFIRVHYGYVKNKAESCTGDCSKDGKNVEIKVSLGGATHTKFNYVQLRPSHDCQTYIFTAYHLSPENVDSEGELYVFKIPKKDIIKLIVAYGGYAHGTIKEHGRITEESLEEDSGSGSGSDSSSRSIKEYAIRTSFNDSCWKELTRFRIPESEI